MKCSVCENPQVKEIDTLLSSGSSIRTVSRLYGLSRSTVSRHRQHARVTGKRLGVIRGGAVPHGTLDLLAEALVASTRARTDRQLLKAAEAVRAAVALQVRALRGGEVDQEMLERLDRNIADAAALYRRVGGFENELRALAGHREAVRQRLEAVKAEGTIDVATAVTLADGAPLPEPSAGAKRRPATSKVTAALYWTGVPARFRDPERYLVQRVVQLHFGTSSKQVIKVYEIETGGLVWSGANVEEG